jgi:hypothetical protein
MTAKQTKLLASDQMNFTVETHPRKLAPLHLVFSKSRVVTTEVFDTYWRFAAERQNVFFRRAAGSQPPWTADPILLRFRFTNAYRATDRVSQFLIRSIQAQGPQDPRSLFFRTILFKLFNRIDTWQLLESTVGSIAPETYDYASYDRVLSDAMGQGRRIYSAAYIMPSGGIEGSRKHQVHLRLLETMMKEDLPSRLADCRSMQAAFELLRSYPMIGDFLAYQYVTDLNYSNLLDFSEMDYVVPGPGARSGIQKCFADRGSYSEADLIRWMAEHQDEEFARRGIEFRSLWGRPLQLIDCQNLFCEVDKYARVYHPDIAGLSSRVRIKQEYRRNPEPVDYWLPPQWALNERIAAWRSSHLAKMESVPTIACATQGA